MLNTSKKINITKITNKSELPDWLSFKTLVYFFHNYMKPYEDTLSDVERGLNDALSAHERSTGGLMLFAEEDKKLVGAVVVLKTGMSGYIPENILLFACVRPENRGQGLGRKLIEQAIESCEGDIKLHVEYDNPAKKLYERVGFDNQYAEMRYKKGRS